MHSVITPLDSPKAVAMGIALRFQADTIWKTVTRDACDMNLALAKLAAQYRLHDYEEDSVEFKMLIEHLAFLDDWLKTDNPTMKVPVR